MTGLLYIVRRVGVAASALLLPSAINGAPPAPTTYGQRLLAATLARHPELASISIAFAAADGSRKVVSAGAPGSVGKFASELRNSSGDVIGAVTMTTRATVAASGQSRVAAELARRIYVVGNLAEPAPFAAGAVGARYAQSLVDRAIDDNLDLITLAMHVTPVGGYANMIIASSFGRIGKAGDKDDLGVIADGHTIRELTNGGKRLAAELPMMDGHGHVIGALSTSFAITPERSADQAFARAVAVRDDIARRTPSIARLTRGARFADQPAKSKN